MILMPLKRKFVHAALIGLLASPAGGAFASDLKSTLSRLDQAAASFKSTSADFEFDTNQTDPVPNTEVLKGTVYYERKGTNFQMAAHIETDDGKKAPKIYSFSQGVFRLDEVGINQVTTIKQGSKFAEYVMLGFGASGKDLADKWNVTDLGEETVENVATEKLELVAKDPSVRKNLPKVTIWMDLSRAVSLKQIFDEGQGVSRVCTYTNFKTNQPLPASAFTLQTDKKTQYVNR
jgi:outer membrane lipoprotein-sorting protein